MSKVVFGTSMSLDGFMTASNRTPVFVITHEPPADPPEDSVYMFVTDGIESALEQAKAAAPGQIVSIGGASIGRQFIQAGLVDEIQITLELEPIEVIHTASAIHMRFRVLRD